MRKKNLKIKMAGNTLMSRFHVSFEIELPLAIAGLPLSDKHILSFEFPRRQYPSGSEK